jgi:hypothetical protein
VNLSTERQLQNDRLRQPCPWANCSGGASGGIERRITVISEDDPGAAPRRASMGSEVRPGDIIIIGQGLF